MEYCLFYRIGGHPRGHLYTCPECKIEHGSAQADPSRIRRPCAGPSPDGKPRKRALRCYAGCQLKGLFAARGHAGRLGTDGAKCCDPLARNIDRWFLDGTIEKHRPAIIAHLRESMKTLGWLEIASAAWKGAGEFTPNPLHRDGIPGAFLDEAIRRAKEAQEA